MHNHWAVTWTVHITQFLLIWIMCNFYRNVHLIEGYSHNSNPELCRRPVSTYKGPIEFWQNFKGAKWWNYPESKICFNLTDSQSITLTQSNELKAVFKAFQLSHLETFFLLIIFKHQVTKHHSVTTWIRLVVPSSFDDQRY